MGKKAPSRPKQIVYLIGAGATQAEAEYLGAPVNLLMRDSDRLGEGIATRILNQLGPRGKEYFGQNGGIDIEKLISLLAASGISAHAELADTMRKQYFRQICESLAEAGLLSDRPLMTAFFELHSNRSFQKEAEALSGVITTNHDGLLQNASEEQFGAVNVGFRFASKDFSSSSVVPPILQLHGSFTWRFAVPVKITSLRPDSKYSTNAVWIPPTILKESKGYPFNKLIALAYELLAKRCDVLRVVGASLTQNDWNILSLVFNSQRHREYVKGTAFRIELIMSPHSGEQIQSDCSYLKNLTPIEFLTEGQFAEYKAGEPYGNPDMLNPWAYWLKEKINFHRQRNEFGDEPLAEAMAKLVGDA